jgi:hypothetical protein
MATQSLARLEELAKTLTETLFSNIGCLVAFQVSAHDARYLTWELDRDQVNEADLTSLPAHHCYVRATVGGEKLPTFSMALRPPDAGDQAVAASVRRRSGDYTKPRQEVATRLERELEKFISPFRQELEKSQATREAKEAQNPLSEGQKGRGKQKSRSKKQPKMAGEITSTGEEEEE